MYEGWRTERWGTPVSDLRGLLMVSLVDDGRLTITLEEVLSPQRIRYRFVFAKYPAYRNILEEHRLKLWQHLDATGQWCGKTFRVTDSPWIASFRPTEPLLDLYFPTLAHYVIATDDDVIEVLSPEPPQIIELGPAPDDAQPPGRSRILYHPQDKSQIADLAEEIQRRNARAEPKAGGDGN